MSVTLAPHTAPDESAPVRATARQQPRTDLDRDLVAVVGMLAILVLTALCFLARTALPL